MLSVNDTSSSLANSNLPILGVHYASLKKLLSKLCIDLDQLQDLTTAEVCEQFIKPHTQPSQSICDRYVSDKTIVGRANWFVNHCWRYKFSEVVDALTTFFDNKPDAIIWFDLFSLPQHGRAKIAAKWLQTTFLNTITATGNVVLILTPWNRPVTLTRAWCVFELYACAVSMSNFHIALPAAQLHAFSMEVTKDLSVFQQTIASIKSEDSEASEEDDVKEIHSVIRAFIGFETLDRMVLSLISNWMLTVAQVQMAHSEREGNAFKQAEWMNTLASLYHQQGRYREAEPLYAGSLVMLKRELGEDDRNVIQVDSSLGMVRMRLGRLGEAEELLRDCVERSRRVLDEADIVALAAVVHLGIICDARGRYREAEEILSRQSEQLRQTLGTRHRLTLLCIGGMGLAHMHMKNFQTGQKLLEKAVQLETEVLGKDHENTLHTSNILNSLYCITGQLEKAAPLLEDNLERTQRTLGYNHPTTIKAMANLARLLGETVAVRLGVTFV
ncbi:Kinesin light chain 3 [Rhizophlyctis rosea]|nr:Kinesin light chain 3 [Rhizophlyctis rosea]